MAIPRRELLGRSFILAGGGLLAACDTIQGRSQPRQIESPPMGTGRTVEIKPPEKPNPLIEIVTTQLRTRPSPSDLAKLPSIAGSGVRQEHDPDFWRYLRSLRRPDSSMVRAFIKFSETRETYKFPSGKTTSYLTEKYDVSGPAKGGSGVMCFVEYQTSDDPNYWYSKTSFKIDDSGRIINFHLRRPELLKPHMESLLPKVFDVPATEWLTKDALGSFNLWEYETIAGTPYMGITFRKDGVIDIRRTSAPKPQI